MSYPSTYAPTAVRGCMIGLLLLACLAGTTSAQLSGIKIIGNPGDYPDFSSAVSDLNTLGVSGVVEFRVRPGTYNEQFKIDNVTGTSSTTTVTFTAIDPANKPKVEFAVLAANPFYLVKLELADYFIFENIVFEETGTLSGVNLIELEVSDNITFDGCEFIGRPSGSGNQVTLVETVRQFPVPLNNNDLTFRNSTFVRGDFGIRLNGDFTGVQSQRPVIEGNSFQDQVTSAIDITWHTDISVVANTIEDGSSASASYTALRTSGSDGDMLENKILVSSGQAGIDIVASENDGRRYLIANNFVAVQGVNAFAGAEIADEVDFYHNSIWLSTFSTTASALRVGSDWSEANVLNNLAVAALFGYAYKVDDANWILNSNHNNYHSALGANLASWDGSDQSNLANLQAASGLDASSVSTNVSFVSAVNGDLRLTGASIGDGRLGGIPLVEVPLDIDGFTRSTVRPYMGADEVSANIDPLCGTYTVGAGISVPDYADYNEAVTALFRGVSCAVDFRVRGGTYNEQITIPDVEGASSTNTVTFRRDVLNQPITLEYAGTSGTDNWVVRLDGADHVIFKRHTFNALGTTRGRIIVLKNEADSNRVETSTLNGVSTAGDNHLLSIVYFDTTSTYRGNTFTQNTFSDGTIAINSRRRLANSSGLSITENTFLSQQTNALLLRSQDDLLVSANTFQLTSGTSPVIVWSGGTGGEVSRNEIVHTGGAGIEAEDLGVGSGDTAYIINNFIISDEGIRTDGVNRALLVAHNTVLGTGSGTGISIESGAIPVDVSRNIVINNGGGEAIHTDLPTLLDSDYNDLFTTGGTLGSVGFAPTPYADLATWQTATGGDANSISQTVTFVSDTAPYDLHLSGASDGDVDLGVPPLVDVTDDIDGAARGGILVYMGADEATAFFALCGGYSIKQDGTGDYLNFSQVANDLNNAGISCPVSFAVDNGVYNEQVTFTEIPGASPTDTVLFLPFDPGDPPTIEYASTSPGDNFVVRLDGADHLWFELVKFTNTGTGDFSRVIVLKNGADDNGFSSAVITGASNPTSDAGSLVYGKVGQNENNIFRFSQYFGGFRGIDLVSTDSLARSSGNVVLSVTFLDQVNAGIWLRHQDSSFVRGNTVVDFAGSDATYQGIRFDGADSEVLMNKILMGTGGRAIRFGGGATADFPAFISNNFVVLKSPNALQGVMLNRNHVKFYHNSVVLGTSAVSLTAPALTIAGGASQVEVVNNLLEHRRGGYAYYVETGSGVSSSNYNNFYNTGAFPLAHWQGSDANTVTDFAGLSGTDANSGSVQVFYVDGINGDLHLSGSSIGDATLAGTPLASVPGDIDLDVRSGVAPYMGADEADVELSLNVSAALRVFLEGPYSAGQMVTTLNDLGHLPTNQPFDVLPWSYAGTEQLISAPDSLVDWMLLSLRTGTDPATAVDTIAATVAKFGSVLRYSGGGLPQFAVAPGHYYVVACHLNHLCAMSSAPVDFTSGTGTWDFSSPGQAFTTGPAPMRDLSGTFGLFACDPNRDGAVQSLDTNVFLRQKASGASGYQPADCDMNGNLGAQDLNLFLGNTVIGASSQVP